MPTSTNVTNLKINELTEAQYDTAVQQGIIGANELSILTDANTGSGGIEWVAHIDKPANAQTGTYNTNSVWEITGGLPDGLYEYYFKVLVNNNYYTPVTVVYKVMFKLWTDNGTQYADGDMRYVIDGDWQPRDISDRLPQNNSWSDVFWKKGSDLIIYNSNPPFSSQIYASSDAVANVFEITAITNVNTGDKYIPTGHLYNLDEEQNWDDYIGGMIVYDLVKIPETPTYCYSGGWFRGQDERLLLMLGENTTGTIGTTESPRYVSEVDFTAESTMGGKFHIIIENSYYSYKAKILEATGDLANARILANESGVLIFDANFSTGDSRSVYASLGMKGSSSSKKATINPVDTSWLSEFQTVLTFDTVGAPITPENLGVITQYNGEIPNVAYTKGHFYEATGTAVTVPDAITCEETDTSIGATITCTNVSGFINALATEFGYSTDDIKYWLNQPDSIIQYTEGQAAYWNIPGFQIPENIITTYFSFSPALQSGDYIVWEMTFTPEHQEVQNPAWEEVSVQKSPTTPSTMPTLTVANWSSNTQTVTVNGVTTTNAVLVAPAPASAADWTSAGIICTAQGTDSLTFTCQTTPSNDITVNVCILN
mgnify:CR=1 FL=1